MILIKIILFTFNIYFSYIYKYNFTIITIITFIMMLILLLVILYPGKKQPNLHCRARV